MGSFPVFFFEYFWSLCSRRASCKEKLARFQHFNLTVGLLTGISNPFTCNRFHIWPPSCHSHLLLQLAPCFVSQSAAALEVGYPHRPAQRPWAHRALALLRACQWLLCHIWTLGYCEPTFSSSSWVLFFLQTPTNALRVWKDSWCTRLKARLLDLFVLFNYSYRVCEVQALRGKLKAYISENISDGSLSLDWQLTWMKVRKWKRLSFNTRTSITCGCIWCCYGNDAHGIPGLFYIVSLFLSGDT